MGRIVGTDEEEREKREMRCEEGRERKEEHNAD